MPLDNFAFNPRAPATAVPLIEAAALGLTPDWTLVPKFGHNETIGTSLEDIWLAGGVIVHPTVAGVVTITSTSANDTSAGTSARTVMIIGLDGDFNQIVDVVSLNGTANVTSNQSFLRINNLVVVTVGANPFNDGIITGSIDGNIQVTIDTGKGLNHDVHYCVPAGSTAYMMHADVWRGADREARIELFYKTNGGPWISPGHIQTYRTQILVPVFGGVVLPEKTDVKFQCSVDQSTVSATMYVNFLQKANT